MITITALMDNKPSENKSLIHEHGLSLLVERDGFRVLFDCGAGEAVWYNAYRLGKDVSNIDAVVLSHSHYDHAAGYRDLIEQGDGGKILYTGPHFFEPKYAFDGVCYTDLSAGFDRKFISDYHITHHECRTMTEIAGGIYLIGGFPRVHEFERIGDRFIRLLPEQMQHGTGAAFVKDDFSDEICMAIETAKGIIILVGCSHPGILNMVEWVHTQLKQPIFGVAGGTHMVEADCGRVEKTIACLKKMGLKLLGMSHCSGEQSEEIIRKDQEVMSCHLSVGDTIFFD